MVIIDSAMSKRVKGRRGTEPELSQITAFCKFLGQVSRCLPGPLPLSWKSELAECICQRRQEHKEDSGVGHDSGQVELRFLSS